MIRVIENAVKSNVRCLVQSVNSAFGGRPSVPCEAREQQHQQRQQHDDAAFLSRGRLPSSLLCAGVMTFAGAQLSRLAFDWWREAPEGTGWRLMSRLFGPRRFGAALPMREVKLVPEAAGGREAEAEEEDWMGRALGASLEEACDLLNREGADFARRGQWAKALECFRSAAGEGHPPAQFNLGLYFHTVSVDLQRARTLYQQAASSGHKEAAYNLSTILMAEENPQWESHMHTAASLGLVTAQTFLGSFYFDRGEFVKARRYFGMGLASAEATETCGYWLGRCYEAEGALDIAELWYAQVLKAGGPLAGDCQDRLSRAKMRQSHSAAVLFRLAEEQEEEMGKSWSLGGAQFYVPQEEEEEELRFRKNGPLRRTQSVARCLG